MYVMKVRGHGKDVEGAWHGARPWHVPFFWNSGSGHSHVRERGGGKGREAQLHLEHEERKEGFVIDLFGERPEQA